MPVVGLAEVLIQPSFRNSQRTISREFGPAAERAGRDAGASLGQGMADGLSDETANLEAQAARTARGVAQAQEKVSASRDRVTKASAAESKALGDLRVAQLKLQEVRGSGNAKASQIAAAEERVSAVRARAAAATRQREAADRGLTAATNDLGRAQHASIEANGELHRHLSRTTTEADRSNRSFANLGATLRNAFRGRILGNAADGVNGDSNRIRRDLTQMSQDVAKAGTKGGKAFTQSFTKVIGGLSIVTPAAGAVGAAAIGAVGGVIALAGALKTLAGASALAPAGLMAAGAAAGVMATAFHGIGDALKTATDTSKATTSNARLDAMAMEDAARQISDAEQRAGEVQVESAKKVQDAKRNLADVVKQNAEQQEAALRRVADAERNVERANRSVLQAQLDLNQARADAIDRIHDLNRSLEQAGLSEREAALRYEEALEAYNKGVSLGGDPTSKTMRRLKLDLDQATLGLQTAKEETADLRKEQAQADKEGVNGNKQVKSAEQALADAREAATDAVRDREDAVREVAKVEAESAQNIIDAQAAISEATQEAADAQVDAARSVSDAYRSMERLQIQQAETAAAAGADAALAMAALTPAAQAGVRALLAVYDQLGNIRRIAQEAFFTGFAAPLLNLASTVMPQLATGVGAIATMLGAGAQQLMNSLSAGLGGGVLEQMLLTVADSIGILNRAIDPLVQSFITLGVVGMDYMPRMTTAIADAAAEFNTFIQGAAASGELNRWIDDGIQGFKDLFSIIGSVSGILGGIGDAAAAAGFVSTLGSMADALNRAEAVVNGSTFQTTLTTIFSGAAAGAAGLGDGIRAIGDAFVAGAPALADFLRLGGEIAGTFIGGIANALSNPAFGAGLTAFQEGLLAGVQALAPLLPGLTTAFGSLLTSLRPIVQNLGPTLVTVFTAFATAAAKVLDFLSPLLAKLADSPAIIGFFIAAFTATSAASGLLLFAGNLQKIFGAVGKVIGVFGKLGPVIATVIKYAKMLKLLIVLNPIGALITAVTLLVGALVWFFTKTETGQRIVKAAWDGIKVAISAVADWVTGTLVPALAAAWDGIKAGAMWLYENGIKPAWDGIKSAVSAVSDWFQNTLAPAISTAFDAVAAVFTWLYEEIVKPVFDAIGTVIGWLYDNVIKPYFALISWAFESLGILIDGAIQVIVAIFRNYLMPIFQMLWERVKTNFDGIKSTISSWWDGTVAVFNTVVDFIRNVLGAVFTWLRDNVIFPVWEGIKSIIAGVWENGIKPIFAAVKAFIDLVLAPAFTWFQGVVSGVWNWITKTISSAWVMMQAVFGLIVGYIRMTFSAAWTWLRDSVINPVWNGIKNTISTVWDSIKGVFDRMVGFVRNDIPNAFEAAKDGIGKAWDKIKDIAKKPVEFVINRVINEGLIDTFNKIPGVDIKHLSIPPGFRKGGYTGDGPEDEVAGPVHRREFVMNAKATAAIGKEKLAAMARAAVSGGRGAAASLGEGNMGGFFEGNAAAIRRHGAYFLDVPASMKDWGFQSAAKMWDGAAGVKVAIGRGRLQAHASPRERGGGILGYTTGNNIDMSPSWMRQLGAKQRITVSAHEMGHALGLPHNSRHSIMQPNLANMASSPTALDIRNLQRLYPGGSGKAGSPTPENPLTGLVDVLVGKLKAHFPAGGMFVDAAGGFAKQGIEQATKWVQDIKDGIKNIAGDVADRVRGFFGGGAATAAPVPTLFRDQGGNLPPGLNQVLNATGGDEWIFNKRQLGTLESLAQQRYAGAPVESARVEFTGPVYGDPRHIADEIQTQQRRAISRNNLRKVGV